MPIEAKQEKVTLRERILNVRKSLMGEDLLLFNSIVKEMEGREQLAQLTLITNRRVH